MTDLEALRSELVAMRGEKRFDQHAVDLLAQCVLELIRRELYREEVAAEAAERTP